MKRNNKKRYSVKKRYRRRSRSFRGKRSRRFYGGITTDVVYKMAKPDPTIKSQAIASAQVNNLADVLNSVNNK